MNKGGYWCQPLCPTGALARHAVNLELVLTSTWSGWAPHS